MVRWLGVLGLVLSFGCVSETEGGSAPQPDQAVEQDGGQDASPEPTCPEGQPLDECGECGGPGAQSWYADQDRDGRGDPRIEVRACERPVGFVYGPDDDEPDCATNDTDECGVCGGEGVRTFFADADGDGLGDPATTVVACTAPQAPSARPLPALRARFIAAVSVPTANRPPPKPMR